MHLLTFEPWMGVAMYMHEVIIISLLLFYSSFFSFLGDFSVSHVRERWVRKTNFA
jgi:hypothetical protein